MLAIRLTTRALWLQTLVALAYLIPICTLDTLTGSTVVDGSIGVLLGLYLAAQPACNTIDILFANRSARRSGQGGSGVAGWRSTAWCCCWAGA